MTHATGDERSGDDPLRLAICPECFYNLHGLADEGVCPECGHPYDQNAVVLYGWTPQEAQELARSATSRWIGWTLVAVALGFMLWHGNTRHRVSPRIWTTIVAGVAIVRFFQH